MSEQASAEVLKIADTHAGRRIEELQAHKNELTVYTRVYGGLSVFLGLATLVKFFLMAGAPQQADSLDPLLVALLAGGTLGHALLSRHALLSARRAEDSIKRTQAQIISRRAAALPSATVG